MTTDKEILDKAIEALSNKFSFWGHDPELRQIFTPLINLSRRAVAGGDTRIGRLISYHGEDSTYTGRVAGIVRKFDRESGEHTGPERFIVQDDRGLLLIKSPRTAKEMGVE